MKINKQLQTKINCEVSLKARHERLVSALSARKTVTRRRISDIKAKRILKENLAEVWDLDL